MITTQKDQEVERNDKTHFEDQHIEKGNDKQDNQQVTNFGKDKAL